MMKSYGGGKKMGAGGKKKMVAKIKMKMKKGTKKA